MRRPRIRDVADRAGVSVSTVSVVLNEVQSARVAPETRDRVRKAAQELGYASNAIARSLRTQLSMTIGLVSDEIATTPFAGRMIQGAQDAAWRSGYLLLLVNTGGDESLERHAIEALRQRQVDGVIYATMYHRHVTVPEQLNGGWVVFLDAIPMGSDQPCVVPDERGGAFAAVTELTRHGHRRIGFITDELAVPAAVGRLNGYRRALYESGAQFDPNLVCATRSDTTGGHQAAARLLSLPEPPTALFCFNDRMAMGAYRAAAERNLRIPQDISIVGFDDQDLIAPELAPTLTTVALPHYAMGQWAARRLVNAIAEAKSPLADTAVREQIHTMPCPLVRRNSVGPPSR
ncbi:MAG TPA: LacI family transcriptional regulator [Micromonosporaceae bacterium]|nr:LacI family transcriptional regulator [Micromonosporaceae bacterium]